jgi:CubicO group peptidase (beta-lactamase class C family)
MVPKIIQTDRKLPDRAKVIAEIQRILSEGNVPGASIAIIVDGQEYIAQGFGVQNIASGRKVDRFTIFAGASTTKQRVSALWAKLMELFPDKFHWQMFVQDVLPELMFSNQPTVREEITLLDLCLHRSGMSRHDFIWYALNQPSTEIMRLLQFVALSWLVGREFHYNNLGWLIAGTMLERVTGKTWVELLQENLDRPLGMTRTNYSVKDLVGMDNVATPYVDFGDGKGLTAIEYHACDNIGPAAAMNTCLDDFIKWLQMMLNYGTYNGKQILKAESVRFMQTQHQAIAISDPSRGPGAPEMKFFGYGPGWFIEEFRGYKIAHHGGNMDGMTSLIAMIHELNVGIIVLSNLEGSWTREALMYKIFDAFIACQCPDISPDYDWCTTLRANHEAQAQSDAEKEKQKWTHPPGTTITGPALDLAAYQGMYHDNFWGSASVKLVDGKLAIKLGGDLAGYLEHWNRETFFVKWVNKSEGRTKVTFRLDEEQDTKVVSVENEEYFGGLKRISDVPADIPVEALVETQPMPPQLQRHHYQHAFRHPFVG